MDLSFFKLRYWDRAISSLLLSALPWGDNCPSGDILLSWNSFLDSACSRSHLPGVCCWIGVELAGLPIESLEYGSLALITGGSSFFSAALVSSTSASKLNSTKKCNTYYTCMPSTRMCVSVHDVWPFDLRE